MVHDVAVFVVTTLIAFLFGLVGKVILDAKAQRGATKSLLRTEMVKAYYKYKEFGKMPYYVKESWYEDYEAYKKLKGNSFIEDLKLEIDGWEIE